jgi:hypothetical protein
LSLLLIFWHWDSWSLHLGIAKEEKGALEEEIYTVCELWEVRFNTDCEVLVALQLTEWGRPICSQPPLSHFDSRIDRWSTGERKNVGRSKLHRGNYATGIMLLLTEH